MLVFELIANSHGFSALVNVENREVSNTNLIETILLVLTVLSQPFC